MKRDNLYYTDLDGKKHNYRQIHLHLDPTEKYPFIYNSNGTVSTVFRTEDNNTRTVLNDFFRHCTDFNNLDDDNNYFFRLSLGSDVIYVISPKDFHDARDMDERLRYRRELNPDDLVSYDQNWDLDVEIRYLNRFNDSDNDYTTISYTDIFGQRNRISWHDAYWRTYEKLNLTENKCNELRREIEEKRKEFEKPLSDIKIYCDEYGRYHASFTDRYGYHQTLGYSKIQWYLENFPNNPYPISCGYMFNNKQFEELKDLFEQKIETDLKLVITNNRENGVLIHYTDPNGNRRSMSLTDLSSCFRDESHVPRIIL